MIRSASSSAAQWRTPTNQISYSLIATCFRSLSSSSRQEARALRSLRRAKLDDGCTGAAVVGKDEMPSPELSSIDFFRQVMQLKPAATLPRLDCPELEKQLFGHKNPSDSGYNWERLEWLGDRELNAVAARICFIMAPKTAPIGSWMEKTNVILKSNVLCAQFAEEYKLAELVGEPLPGTSVSRWFSSVSFPSHHYD